MAALTQSLYAAAMREVFRDRIRQQTNDSNIVKRFRKQNRDDVRLEGNGFVVHLSFGRNYSGVRSTGESGFLGLAGNETYNELLVPFRDIKGRFQITDEAILATQSLKGAAAPALSRKMERLQADIERDLNRQLFGYGKGILGVISAGATSATQTIKDPGNVVGTVNPTRWMKAGDVLAFQTGSTLDNVEVVNSTTNTTVVLAASITTATDDIVLKGSTEGGGDSSSDNKEWMGLLGIIDGTTYLSTIFGLDRSSVTGFQSGVKTSVGALSEDFLYRAIHDQLEVSGEWVDTFFVHYSIEREYYKLTQADRRYTSDSQLANPDAGVNLKAEPMFGHIAKWVADKDGPYGTLLAACSPHLFVAYLEEGDWEDFGGRGQGEVLRFISGKTDYEGVWRSYGNIYSDRGNCHFRLDGVTATVTTANTAD